ncbi:NAD(P)-dependent oxidoreductase [Cupriavidus basilensis]|uniref:NAD(P)-dependent oxidoreductase n=1 Tax=Cupriavidus basilensis TaxID=68895 RepID=A0ABT6AP56_9BURK|nr:NAD(P)-dependent oxidoreductase [Cupriavidus basilensis]MDF3834383.1 NAD(P)-dependent oxidoreductase [Cupriavidus basilensis]
MKQIGFVGLGMMGFPMAGRLVAAGVNVLAYDVVAQTRERFAAEHKAGRVAADLQEFGDCDAVVTMLPNSEIVDEAVLTLTKVLQRGALVVDMSSADPVRTRTLLEAVKAAGLTMIDAPVSGGVSRARAGTLAIMAGGNAADVDRVRPLLGHLGSTLTHVGGIGAGHAMKALNNYVSAAGLIATAEALIAGQRFGIDPNVMVDVLNSSTGKNNTTENKAKQFMLSGAFNSGFSLALMAKDVGIAAVLAEAVDAAMPLGVHVNALCTQASKELGKGADHTEMYRFVEHP